MRAPFPYFGGKGSITDLVWQRFGSPRQYIEPFCGSAAVLLAAPRPASLEVVNDINGFIANFWRATKHQPTAVAEWADYPVSHIDLGARHRWLMGQRGALGEALHDPDWPGDPKVAGWWLWGQCCWIGSGWCDWIGRVPHASDAGRGVQALGQVPHASSAGMGVQALGQVPHANNAGREVPLLTSSGQVAMRWLSRLAARLERVRVVHGSWDRCLNMHYGDEDGTTVFLDPPYAGSEDVYGVTSGNDSGIAEEVARWAIERGGKTRIALCGLAGHYALDGWEQVRWSRGRLTYGGAKTTTDECIWFSPACVPASQEVFTWPAP